MGWKERGKGRERQEMAVSCCVWGEGWNVEKRAKRGEEKRTHLMDGCGALFIALSCPLVFQCLRALGVLVRLASVFLGCLVLWRCGRRSVGRWKCDPGIPVKFLSLILLAIGEIRKSNFLSALPFPKHRIAATCMMYRCERRSISPASNEKLIIHKEDR